MSGQGGKGRRSTDRRRAPPPSPSSGGPAIALAVIVASIVLGGGWAVCRSFSTPYRSASSRGAEASARTGKTPALDRARRSDGIPSERLPGPDLRGTGAAGAATASGSRNRRFGHRSSSGIPATGDDGLLTGSGSGAASGDGQCSGLGCQVHDCAGGGSTTISGTIYDPAGKQPLYNVVAYVPGTTPARVAPGASCSSCADLYTGDPVASAVSDAAGHFTINDAPDGADIPLVIQVGKWRRQFVLPTVARCTNTAVPDKTLTLPKNGREGDLPDIAVSTGGSDSIECLLRRIGVDDSEYVPGAGGNGHLHIFKGEDHKGTEPAFDTFAPDTSPRAPSSSAALWDSITDIMRYDLVILNCEAYPPTQMNQQVLFEYAAAGGRVLAEHSHYAWFATGPFGAANLAQWTAGVHPAPMSLGVSIVTTTWANQPFPRGQAFSEWLFNVDALAGNVLAVDAPPHYNAYVTAANTASQPWLVANNGSNATMNFSFDTPIGAAPADQCGRVVFSDMHVGQWADYAGTAGRITPAGCVNAELRPQEKALEFALFDLASCVTPGNIPQDPPVP
jgi:hypothetical protein